MEFAGPVDFTREIVTYRDVKWERRIWNGAVIEVEKVHQGEPGRHLARVISTSYEQPPAEELGRLQRIYGPGPRQYVKIVLRVDPALRKDDADFATWETKTTRLQR